MSSKITFSFNVDGIGPHYSENTIIPEYIIIHIADAIVESVVSP